MAGDNFQEVVVLRTDDKLEIRGEAIIIGGTATDAQSVVFRDVVNDLEGHLAWNPDQNRTLLIPNVDGTLLVSGQAIQGFGVSTLGNTAGSTGTTVGTVVLVGGNQITLSQSTNVGSSATITISGRDAIFGAGISTGGNTSGTSGTNTGTLVFAGGNNVTLSQATGAGGNTITISAPNMVSSAGVSTQGNTAGNTGLVTGSLILAGSNGVTLSQSTVAGGAIVWIQVKKNPIIFFATGRYRVSTGIDIQEAGDNFTISTVVLRRQIAGTSGSTTIDVLKNGVSIFNLNPGNRPTVTAAGGDNQRVTATPDTISIASTDKLEMEIVTVESGSPQDAVVELIFA